MAAAQAVVDEVTPDEAFATMKEIPGTVMVDVRTRAEWTFVGVPDLTDIGRPLWLVEWVQYPSMAPNEAFLEQIRKEMGGEKPERIFFICRSGARSMAAARHVAEAFAAEGVAIHCTNVAEGFEGDRDAGGHRGTRGGWKHHGLPWVQS